jgi:hypothetical protein
VTPTNHAGRSVLCPQCGNLVGAFDQAGRFESRHSRRVIRIDPPVNVTVCCESCHSCWRVTGPEPTQQRVATPTYRR